MRTMCKSLLNYQKMCELAPVLILLHRAGMKKDVPTPAATAKKLKKLELDALVKAVGGRNRLREW
jgi:hypothetical protein